jgi:lipopolysaccharide/colanic/teichoic acid biosynthesis glycosyltransferase
MASAFLSPLVAVAMREPLPLTPDYISGIIGYCALAFSATMLILALSQAGHGLPVFFSHRDAIALVRVASLAIAITMIVLFAATRLNNIPRSLPAIHLFVLVAGLIGGRWLLTRLVLYRESPPPQRPAEPVLVIGANRWAWLYASIVDTLLAGRQKIVAILDDEPRVRGRSIHGQYVIGALSDLESVVDEYRVHGVVIRRVVVAGRLEDFAEPSLAHLKRVCAERGLRRDILAERLRYLYEDLDEAVETGSKVSSNGKIEAIHALPYWRVKRGFDFAVAGLLLIVLAPLFLLTWLTVLLALGRPSVFWQQRVGRNRKPVFIYKFRTLLSPFRPNGSPISESARLTTTGRLLRATRLDELPQLVNILRGDMSIVGPRPLMPVDQPQSAELRLSVAPGLTGWAQVHGGKLITAAEKGALDEWYIRNASFWLDLLILAKTPTAVILGDRRDEHVLSRAIAESDTRAAEGYACSIPFSQNRTPPDAARQICSSVSAGPERNSIAV